MHRFFVEPGQVLREENRIVICGSDVNHIKNVLRLKAGDSLVVSDGSGMEYTCRLEKTESAEVTAEILASGKGEQELQSGIVLYQGLPKSDKMEWIIQKAVELGVAGIVPMTTRRTVVKLDAGKEESRRKRWQSIAEGAAKQSGRAVIPRVEKICSFREAAVQASEKTHSLIPYEMASESMRHTRDLLGQICKGESVAVMIGPEGGFDPEEIAYAVSLGIRPITLGKRILRTETAGMTVLSILMYLLES